MIIDAHADFLWKLSQQAGDAKRSAFMQQTIQIWWEQGLRLQVLPIFVEPNGTEDEQWQSVLWQLEWAHRFIESDQRLLQIDSKRTYETWERSHNSANPRIGIVIALEGCDALETNTFEKMDRLFERGLRIIGITWNPANAFADGCHEEMHGGLSKRGIDLINYCEGTGVIIDAAHLSERSFWDLCKVAKKPFLNSHSNSSKVFPHPRNLTDQQIQEIISRDGMVGLNVVPFLLGIRNDVEPDQSFRRWYDHLRHVIDLGAQRHVGFGSDLWGADFMISALADASMWKAWLRRLENENTLKSEHFLGLRSENWRRFFRNALM